MAFEIPRREFLRSAFAVPALAVLTGSSWGREKPEDPTTRVISAWFLGDRLDPNTQLTVMKDTVRRHMSLRLQVRTLQDKRPIFTSEEIRILDSLDDKDKKTLRHMWPLITTGFPDPMGEMRMDDNYYAPVDVKDKKLERTVNAFERKIGGFIMRPLGDAPLSSLRRENVDPYNRPDVFFDAPTGVDYIDLSMGRRAALFYSLGRIYDRYQDASRGVGDYRTAGDVGALFMPVLESIGSPDADYYGIDFLRKKAK